MKNESKQKIWKWVYKHNLLIPICILTVLICIIFFALGSLPPILSEDEGYTISELENEAKIVWDRHIPGLKERITDHEKGITFLVDDDGISVRLSNSMITLSGQNKDGELVFEPISNYIRNAKFESFLTVVATFAASCFLAYLLSSLIVAGLVKDLAYKKMDPLP